VEVLANRHFARRHHEYLHSAVRAMESIWAKLVELEEMFWPEDVVSPSQTNSKKGRQSFLLIPQLADIASVLC
jgi:hypothetical protein